MTGKIRTYRDLDIWKAGIQLVKEVYKLTEQFPKQEMYGLVSHKQFLYVSLGSCAELETQTTIAKELEYISEDKEARILERLDHICRMISNLLKKL